MSFLFSRSHDFYAWHSRCDLRGSYRVLASDFQRQFCPTAARVGQVFLLRNVEMPAPHVFSVMCLCKFPRIFCNSTPTPQVTFLCNSTPTPHVTVDVSVPQDLNEIAEAVRLAESAPMPKTLKEKTLSVYDERLSFPWIPHGLNAERTCFSAARTCHGGLLRSVAPSFIFWLCL